MIEEIIKWIFQGNRNGNKTNIDLANLVSFKMLGIIMLLSYLFWLAMIVWMTGPGWGCKCSGEMKWKISRGGTTEWTHSVFTGRFAKG